MCVKSSIVGITRIPSSPARPTCVNKRHVRSLVLPVPVEPVDYIPPTPIRPVAICGYIHGYRQHMQRGTKAALFIGLYSMENESRLNMARRKGNGGPMQRIDSGSFDTEPAITTRGREEVMFGIRSVVKYKRRPPIVIRCAERTGGSQNWIVIREKFRRRRKI